MDNKRQEGRRAAIKGAKIIFGNSIFDCVVLDISTAGARVRTDAMVVVPEQVILKFSGGSSFTAHRRWSRGTELGFEFSGPAPLTEHAAFLAMSAVEALPLNGLEEPLRILRAARFFDDPALTQAAEEAESAYAKFKEMLRARISLKP